MSADANSSNSATLPTDGPTPSFSFLKKSIAVSPEFAAQGLRDLAQEQVTSVSAPAGAHDLRKDGGLPSSAAFASEHAKDADRFAALNLETRDQSVSLSTQMKRDFLLAQATPPAPPGFAAGPSLAHRPISRTGSMAGDTLRTALTAAALLRPLSVYLAMDELDDRKYCHCKPSCGKLLFQAEEQFKWHEEAQNVKVEKKIQSEMKGTKANNSHKSKAEEPREKTKKEPKAKPAAKPKQQHDKKQTVRRPKSNVVQSSYGTRSKARN
ncbi:hypothetical protein C8F04DRAFT_1253015 [Mycena alexandri]|uniref:Uncharacterized protein n=1 Tax=Mycena alexandri TaxID=1745969 RepID=A0AAD6XDJ1_9AGAR|nr:hypothetical protein C8F04DRAFT_1253015 [Mycena alexandri]